MLSLYGICPDALRLLRRFLKIRHGSFEGFALLYVKRFISRRTVDCCDSSHIGLEFSERFS